MSTKPRPRWRPLLSLLFMLAAGIAIGFALAGEWHRVRGDIARISAGAVIAAVVLVVGASFAVMQSWRALLADLGSNVDAPAASRIFFIGQLGKYLPGSVWPVLAQMELGALAGVPRRRSAVAGVLNLLVSLAAGALVAAALLPFYLPGGHAYALWGLVGVPLAVLLVRPAVVNPALRVALRLLRQPPFERGLSGRGLTTSVAWAVLAWMLLGSHLWLVARDLGGHGADLVLVCAGAFAAAWVAGFVFVFAPVGAGVREVVLVLSLAVALPRAAASTAALVSRLVLTAVDLLLGGGALLLLGGDRMAVLHEGARNRRSEPAPVAADSPGPSAAPDTPATFGASYGQQ